MQNVGKVHLRVRNETDKEKLVRVDILLESVTIFIRFSSETESWPFIVRNETDLPLTFGQAVRCIPTWCVDST